DSRLPLAVRAAGDDRPRHALARRRGTRPLAGRVNPDDPRRQGRPTDPHRAASMIKRGRLGRVVGSVAWVRWVCRPSITRESPSHADARLKASRSTLTEGEPVRRAVRASYRSPDLLFEGLILFRVFRGFRDLRGLVGLGSQRALR